MKKSSRVHDEMKKKKQKQMKPGKTHSSHRNHQQKHPPYFEMIKEALSSLNNKDGSSSYAIAKFMKEKYKNLPSNFRKILLTQLKKLVDNCKLKKIKASYKLLSSAEIEMQIEEQEAVLQGKKTLKPYVSLDVPGATEEMKEKFMNLFNKPVLRGARHISLPEREKMKTEEEKEKALWLKMDEEEKLKKKEEDKMKELKRKEYIKSWEDYSTHLTQTQGFDFDKLPVSAASMDVPSSLAVVAAIYPVIDFKKSSSLKNICLKALAEFNTLNGTHFEFVTVLKANCRSCGGGITYYATFLARMAPPPHEILFTFQARGFHRCAGDRIHFCRLKQDVGGGGSVVDSEVDGETEQPLEASDSEVNGETEQPLEA